MKKDVGTMVLSALLILTGTTYAGESEEAYNARMKWWDDGRLGMFMHWGVYSVFGGEYGGLDYGKEMGNASAEWIYLRSGMPKEDYVAAARRFNPEKYDPRQWVAMAKDAGMTYMVLTAKHHDGFALFDTEASDWNAVRSSGAGRDLIKEYVDACHEAGMKVGFYYSHEKDWVHHLRAAKAKGDMPKDYEALALKQVEELLTHYGKIDLMWFDTPNPKRKAFNRKCVDLVRKHQPHCIINGRIGSGLGDYQNIGDRAIVKPGLAGYMESIMTMRLNWGYDRNDDFWKPSSELIRMVSKSACRGSNFLLNIGPTPEGAFPVEDEERLKDLSRWIKKHGEAIYRTKGNPYGHEHAWGSITLSKEAPVVYLHLSNWRGGDITLKGLQSKVGSAAFLDSGEDVAFSSDPATATVRFRLPADDDGLALRVLKLTLKEAIRFDMDQGPDFTPPVVHHQNHVLFRGKITEVKGDVFTADVRQRNKTAQGAEVLSNKAVSRTFTLNDSVRYRINTNGAIRCVPRFDLKVGEECRIVLSPSKGKKGEGGELKIITRMVRKGE